MNLLQMILSNIEPLHIKGFYYRKRVFHKGYAKYKIDSYMDSYPNIRYVFICFVSSRNVKERLKK